MTMTPTQKQTIEIEINWITEDEASWPPKETWVLVGNYGDLVPDCFWFDDNYSQFKYPITDYDYWFTPPEVKRP